MNKSWLYLILTSVFELFWVYGFNVASTWWHWLLIATIILIDFYFLSKACEGIPTGTVYATFAGIGTTGTALMDAYVFGGFLSLGKIFFMVVLIIGVIGLNLADRKEALKGAN
ncbi:DMT family transporter [Peribacillus asahii]|uniref:DMT family transporter n=1 Tax=Peribacillus asahii TaxID=228899 RepID=UPI002079A437|nr:SMR family transporter [Peribacillus asahii]USK69883.1 QacE family quaternary ammonium compound efflux SMR transporter [Peribacillus asahii]